MWLSTRLASRHQLVGVDLGGSGLGGANGNSFLGVKPRFGNAVFLPPAVLGRGRTARCDGAHAALMRAKWA